ncbi:MAG TPA: DUF3616 domain-containing protein [Azospirillaceae bacterium]|nr:DUF3616 domain-containing protein [Azospirillaceae bacterium]
MPPSRPILLDLTHGDVERDEALRADISVLALDGPYLFTASDETAAVERLTAEGSLGEDGRPVGTAPPPDRFGGHVSFRLHDLIDLPDPKGEVDVEGMDVEDGWLWIVGSHSLARRKPKPDEQDTAAMLARLESIKREPNRYLLARIPLEDGPDGRVPVRRAADGRRSSWLPFARKHGNALTKAIGKDPQLAPFLSIPAKENGFDVEGLAVAGDRVFLGLRGPVLRGWAVILELDIGPGKKGGIALAGKGAAAVRKHFLDLDGLGIRELCRDGDDLLILAGPTMDLDGPVRVWRWAGACTDTGRIVPRDRLGVVLDVPYGTGFDHAEGLGLRPRPDGGRDLLVAYDNPGPARLRGATAVVIDAFPLPG